MAEAFGIGAGIVGVIGLAIQITQVVVQFGLDWKDAPNEVKSFLAELQTLKTVLSETNTNIILNSDFAEAFQNRSSLLISQLGTGAPSTTDTKLMLAACQRELESLLSELKKRAKGHRVGWERFKGAFLAKNTREAVENLHRQCQTLNSMVMIDATVLGATTYKEVKEARKEHLEWHQAETDQEILTWLTTTDYGAQQSDFLNQRQEGTGRWLLDSDEFGRWSNGDIQTLFCQGMPGAGKTIMASIVIDHLYKYQNDGPIGIAYLYCNFRRQHEQSPVDLFASLLKQLIQRLPSVPQSVKTLYKHHKDKQTRPSFDEISKELHSSVAGYSRTFIIIDALDECQVSDGGRKRLLSEVFYLQMKTGVSLFTTSRFIPEIMKEFEGSVSLEIRASDEDVRRYIDGHMSQLPSFVLRNPDLQEDVRMEITKAVDGMFLLAQLHLGSLIGKRSPKAIRIALEKLPKGSEAYDHAYKEAMERIEGQVADSQELARQVLTWITCARRPLTTLELRHALAVEVGESELDSENLPEIEDMVSVCAGLVTVDEESEIIRLVHYTTQEYFERTWKSWFPNAQNCITVSCVTYLSFDNFESGFCPTDKEFEARLRSNPLYDYAARNWGHHAHAAATELEPSILGLLESHTKLSACSQAMMASKRYLIGSHYSQDVPREMTGAHLAAYFGLRQTMISLLESGQEPNRKDTYGQTPLSWAARNGHEMVVKLLLQKDGVDLDSKDTNCQRPGLWVAQNEYEAAARQLVASEGSYRNYKRVNVWTPLLWAAINGHEAVVRLLLEKDAIDPDFKDGSVRTPLSWAAINGHEAVVKLLLEKDGVDPDPKDIHRRTPLWYAAERGHDAVVNLLLSKDGVNPDSTDWIGVRPLWRAAQNGHTAVVKLLLGKDSVDPDSRDTNGQAPLSWAAMNAHKEVVKLLLAKDGSDPDPRDTNGQTPLRYAAERGHDVVVSLLLSKDGVNPDSEDNIGVRPLWRASQNGHKAVVKLLLEKDGVNPDSKDIRGRTPLSWATMNGHEAVMRLLLEKDDVDPDSKDINNRTPLSWAAQNGHEAVVKLFPKDSVDLDFKDPNGRTPLSWAAQNGHEAVVLLLLAKDSVDPDSKDINGQTPLSWAAKNGHETVVKLLLAKENVNPNSKDIKFGQTPLSWAAEAGHDTVVELFLAEDDVNVNLKDANGRTPLWCAAEGGHKTVVKLLLTKESIDLESRDVQGQTPLCRTAQNGHEAVIRLLLAQDGIDPDSKDRVGRTPLSWAAENGHREVVKLLLGKDGVDSDSKDYEYGRTPLSWAAASGRESVAKLLLAEDGVDPDSKDKINRTPLSWAAQNGWGAAVEVVELLLANDRVKPHSKDKYGRTPLSWAVKKVQEAAKALPAEGGIDREPQATIAQDRWKAAAEVVELLLARD